MITMKKQSIVNLIRYHSEKNNEAFISEAADIAREFELTGDSTIAQYIMELISTTNFVESQSIYNNFIYLQKEEYSTKPLLLPSCIEEDIIGIVKAISKNSELSKFLFFGAPGTGKTEAANQIARLLSRNLYYVRFEQLIDSRLGQTARNVSMLFDEMKCLSASKSIVLFDEIDSLVLDRINQNDHREMGRVTSTFLKELDRLNNELIIIATTNLYQKLDKALTRRFDAQISFDRYTKKDLIDIADAMLRTAFKGSINMRQDIRLFNKILNKQDNLPYPGDLKQIIKTAVAFSDESNEYDYLRRIYLSLNDNPTTIDIQQLSKQGYTTREIEILSKIPKSSVSRKLKGVSE